MRKRGFEKISREQYVKDFNDKMVKYEDLKLPKRATSLAAGYDFFAPFTFELKPGEIIKIPTGMKVYMLKDECLAILMKSGLGFKYNLRLCN